MDKTAILRKVLVIGAGFNFGAAVILVSGRLRALAGFPEPGSGIYVWMLGLFVAVFGGVYLWLSFQPEINRPLVAVSAIGKLGVFVISVFSWLMVEIPARAVIPAVADLGFALIFLWWLRGKKDIVE
jgi:hypothetical protein